MLKDKSILNTGDLDDNDETLAKWNDGSISFNELLDYAITKDIVNISALNLKSDYLDTNEIYQALIEYVAQELPLYEGFEKKAIYYMLESDYISGTDICLLLYSQHVLEEDDDYQASFPAVFPQRILCTIRFIILRSHRICWHFRLVQVPLS